ncbi:MAG: hypothetical protein EOO09_19485 [Chitinophagaceae bacterium]|nr:MAG: hypothetical protein EOO09_19485 [Chitinophagaceae bacterium]
MWRIAFVMLAVICHQDQQVTKVIGRAENLKQGAIVISKSNNKAYEVDGLRSWDSSLLNRQVEVTGILVIYEYKPRPDGEEAQEVHAARRVLTKPKWIKLNNQSVF